MSMITVVNCVNQALDTSANVRALNPCSRVCECVCVTLFDLLLQSSICYVLVTPNALKGWRSDLSSNLYFSTAENSVWEDETNDLVATHRPKLMAFENWGLIIFSFANTIESVNHQSAPTLVREPTTIHSNFDIIKIHHSKFSFLFFNAPRPFDLTSSGILSVGRTLSSFICQINVTMWRWQGKVCEPENNEWTWLRNLSENSSKTHIATQPSRACSRWSLFEFGWSLH